MAGVILAVVMAAIGMVTATFGWAILSYSLYNLVGWGFMLLAAFSFFVATVAWFNRKEI